MRREVPRDGFFLVSLLGLWREGKISKKVRSFYGKYTKETCDILENLLKKDEYLVAQLCVEIIERELQYQADLFKDKRTTAIERLMAGILDARGVTYEREKGIHIYHIDFYLPTTNTALEVFGCYWHGCVQCGYNNVIQQGRRRKDQERIAYLQAQSFNVHVIWEHDLKIALKVFRRAKQWHRLSDADAYSLLVEWEKIDGVPLEQWHEDQK